MNNLFISRYNELYEQLNLRYHDKYSAKANKRRHKRGVIKAVGEDNKGTCVLSIQTDPMLWEHIRRRVSII